MRIGGFGCFVLFGFLVFYGCIMVWGGFPGACWFALCVGCPSSWCCVWLFACRKLWFAVLMVVVCGALVCCFDALLCCLGLWLYGFGFVDFGVWLGWCGFLGGLVDLVGLVLFFWWWA